MVEKLAIHVLGADIAFVLMVNYMKDVIMMGLMHGHHVNKMIIIMKILI